MTRTLHVRLSLLMFLQYVVPACTLPILGLYLTAHLHFKPEQVGWIYAMPATAALITPYFISQVVDRWMSAERLTGFCHLLCAVLMLGLYLQESFYPFLFLYLAHSLLFAPTVALTNAVVLRHVPDAQKDFGRVRLWGTFAWIAVAWVFGFIYLNAGDGPASERLPHVLVLCALASAAVAVYSLTLPRPHVHSAGTPATFLPWKVFRDFRERSLVVLLLASFFFSVGTQFYFTYTSVFLSAAGFETDHIMPAMSIGLFFEMGMLFFVGSLLGRFGTKTVFLVALAGQGLRYLLFMTASLPAIYLGLSFQGLAFTFYAAAVVYIDRRSTPHKRSSMQQLYGLVMGLGNLIGSLFAGWTGQLFTQADSTIYFPHVWFIAATLSALAILTVALGFPRRQP